MPDSPVDVNRFDAVILVSLRPPRGFQKARPVRAWKRSPAAAACWRAAGAEPYPGRTRWKRAAGPTAYSGDGDERPQQKNPRRFARRGGAD